MLPDIILQFFLYVICLIIKIITASIVILLIIRSLVSKFRFFSKSIYIQALYSITEIFIRPVRTILPQYLWKKGIDYSPLISAIFILFIGFGLNSFMKIIFGGLLLFL